MKLIKRIILLLITALIAMGAVTYVKGYKKYTDALALKPLEESIAEIKNKEDYTKYEDISKTYFDALIAVEDRRFYKHNGLDIIGTSRAIYNDIKAGKYVEGGSTLSQQIAKNLYFPLDYTLDRKIAEVILALRLEKEFNKEEILELYANLVYYGSGYYCIYDASMGYFDKKPSELTDNEATLLAGIPNAPSVYSLDVNPDLAYKRQEKVLDCMVELEYLTKEEAEKIIESR